MRLVSPDEFSDACISIGFRELKKKAVPLKMGKAFHVGYYRKDAEPVAAEDD